MDFVQQIPVFPSIFLGFCRFQSPAGIIYRLIDLQQKAPHTFVTGCGAWVASQQCSVLRAGSKRISLLHKMSRRWCNMIQGPNNISSRRLRL